ncbi:MAG: S1 family peptidase, partial [Arthrobacter sp.]|nr:S1 family peptidase [Arthrobacter sp.]
MTPKFQLTVRAVAAAALALAGSFQAVPALAEAGGPEPVSAASPSFPAATPAPVESTTPAVSSATTVPALADTPAPSAAPEISDAGLAEAIRRDLGMTLEEFNAAGQLARTAADALPSLQELPGYLGISLRDEKILVEGSGAELMARVDELNASGSAAEFVLVAPAADAAAPPASASSAVDPSTPPSGAPSAAPSAAELLASSTEQLFQSYVREVGPAGLQAVAYSGGKFIIRTGGTNTAEAGLSQAEDQQIAPATVPDQQAATAPEPAATATAPGKMSPADFVARYANVQLEQGSQATTEADVFGGEGIAIDRLTICSTGFGAFSAAGLPVVLTAGHCAQDGTARIAELEPPTSATAGGSLPLPRTLAPLGNFGFSQFGGLNNSPVLDPVWETGDPGDPGNVGTDIAVIEALDGGINLQPAATTWADAANRGATAVKIIGVVAPFPGQEVCLSGRTSGWSCGQVEETGIYVVGGRTYPAKSNDVRAFRGFRSLNIDSSGGDSGGSWISGNYAVGTHSAGEKKGASEKFSVATTLEDALTKIPTGVQLQLFLNKPELAAPEGLAVLAGQPITGRVPAAPASAVAADSKVRITIDKQTDEEPNQQTVEVPVDADGTWAFPAPESNGPLKFTAETVNGFSRSGAVSLAVEVTDLDAPVISSPDEGAVLKTLTRIDGTGTPGHTVKLTGDITGTAVVAADGQWTIPVEEDATGPLTIRAVQTSPGTADSPPAVRNFTVVVPAEPVVPVEPVVPAEPVVPVEPIVPLEPVVPAEPAAPIVAPAAPVAPAEPANPVLPAGASQP